MGQRAFPFLTILLFSTSALVFESIQTAYATHLRAGEITVTRISCSGLKFRITITVYTNTGSVVKFSSAGDGNLDFGDGSPIFHPPQQDNSPVPGFGPQFGVVAYSIEHTYGSNGQFVISYQEANRNAGILNITNSVETPFYIETMINIDPLAGCDDSPQLLIPPIDQACTGVAFYHNPGAYSPYPDGDSLSYQMAIPKQDILDDVAGYLPPNSERFYDAIGVPYGQGNENKDGPPTFGIDPISGTITWAAPGAEGEYNIAFQIIAWRKVSGVWIMMSYVTRDMQIIVQNCNNHRPSLTVPADICVEAGTTISQQIFGSDPDGDSVKIEVFSESLIIGQSPATFTPNPVVYQAPGNAVGQFTWNTQCDHIREQPYEIVIKITDKPPPNPGVALVLFKTWNIRVVAPAPQWISVQPQTGRKAKLSWENYVCGNADSMEIWRRVNSFPFTPPACVTGMPGFLGFTMIAKVPIATTQYIDTNGGKGLSPGAEYCYRLEALFPLSPGGQRYISEESCFTAVANAPIITNVSIDKTDKTAGQDTIKWIGPLVSETDTVQFPLPYKFSLYRAEGFSGDANLTPVFSGETDATFYVDNELNTSETVYNYRVVAFDNDGSVLDTSATASAVRLELKPHAKNIELDWNAVVPWSNQSTTNPLHSIYRGPANSTMLTDMQLIDNIDVTEHTFHYLDSGQWNNTPLEKMQTYCYCVKTQGSYGNAEIFSPLANYSQIICAQPEIVTGDITSLPPTVYVYPNPSHDFVIVKGITSEVGNSYVIDLMGRPTILRMEKQEDWLKADISFLPVGMYILRVSEGNAVHQMKFIKQ